MKGVFVCVSLYRSVPLFVLVPCLCLSLHVVSLPLSVCHSCCVSAFPLLRGCGHGKLSLGGGTSVPVPAKVTSVNTGHPGGLGKEAEACPQGPLSPTYLEPSGSRVPSSAQSVSPSLPSSLPAHASYTPYQAPVPRGPAVRIPSPGWTPLSPSYPWCPSLASASTPDLFVPPSHYPRAAPLPPPR